MLSTNTRSGGRHLLAVMVVAALALVAAAAPARASSGNLCVNVPIDTGHTCVHGISHTLTIVNGQSTGTAIACVGSKLGSTASSADYVYWGNFCAAFGGSIASTGFINSCNPVTSSYPDIHNHSKFHSVFTGTFQYAFC
jgi:hypothetical protein